MQKSVIIRFAFQSRLFIVALQFIANLLIEDHKAGVFEYPKTSNYTKTIVDTTVDRILGGFLRWDAQYFMHIAKYGYTYENTVAFFPLYPLTVRHIGHFLSIFVPFMSIDSVFLICFVTLNVLFFCCAALCLYKLTVIFFSEDFAYRAVILFCVNPASIFFSAPYSESLFSYLTFKSMLNCVKLYQKYSADSYDFHIKDIIYLTPIALSCITRSNGLLNIGFFLYTLMCIIYENHKACKSTIFERHFFKIVVVCLIYCLLPFMLFQGYMFRRFCEDFIEEYPVNIVTYALKEKFVMPGQFSLFNQSWCYHKLPLSYSYVQAHYWDVGFLKYYSLKQLPNFILAFPAIAIILTYCVIFLRKNIRLDLKSIFSFRTKITAQNVNIFHPALLVYIVHAFTLTSFCIFFVHIQVTTRMLLSASPVVYWFTARQYLSIKTQYSGNLSDAFVYKSHNHIQKFIKYYFLGYTIVGTVMFCNFLPWT